MSTTLLLLLASLVLCLPLKAWAASAEDSLRVDTITITGLEHPAAGLNHAVLNERLGQERARFSSSMTVDELNTLADSMTLFVRSFGFAFHTVFLPPQKVQAGQVHLRLQEGVLAKVNVINKTDFNERLFADAFAKELGAVLYGPAVERQVQGLKAQGGFSVFAFYSRGTKPGEMVLNLRADKANTRAYGLRLDNYGSAVMGKQRLIGQFSQYQLTNHHDRLDLGLLQTLGDVSNQYASLGYQLPFGRLRYLWDISYTNNEAELGDRLASLGITGNTRTYGTGLSFVGDHQPHKRRSARLGIYAKKNTLDAGVRSVLAETSQALTAAYSANWGLKTDSVFSGQIEYSYGEAQVAGLADSTFNKVELTGLYSQGFGAGSWRQLLQLNARAQYSDTSMPSIEGMALTGAYGVRGFAPGLFNAERGLLASAEWRLPNLLKAGNWRLEPYLLAEYGSGQDLYSKGPARKASMQDVGVGASLSVGKQWRMNIAVVAGLDGSVGVELDTDQQVLCELRWQH